MTLCVILFWPLTPQQNLNRSGLVSERALLVSAISSGWLRFTSSNIRTNPRSLQETASTEHPASETEAVNSTQADGPRGWRLQQEVVLLKPGSSFLASHRSSEFSWDNVHPENWTPFILLKKFFSENKTFWYEIIINRTFVIFLKWVVNIESKLYFPTCWQKPLHQTTECNICIFFFLFQSLQIFLILALTEVICLNPSSVKLYSN